MRIAVPLETAPGEQRVALTSDSAARLVKGGHEIRIQAGAGTRAGFPDSAYETSGAVVSDAATLYTDAELVESIGTHQPIVDALTSRDPRAAEAAARAHVELALSVVLRTLR